MLLRVNRVCGVGVLWFVFLHSIQGEGLLIVEKQTLWRILIAYRKHERQELIIE